MDAIWCRCQITLQLNLKVLIIFARTYDRKMHMFEFICVEGEEKLKRSQ